MQTLENYIILFIFIARKREMKKRELRNEEEMERYRKRMRGIFSSRKLELFYKMWERFFIAFIYIVINEGSCTFIHYQMNDSHYGLIMVIHV